MTHANTLLTQCVLNPICHESAFLPNIWRSGAAGDPHKERRLNLHLTESSAHPGMLATAESEREYWLSRQKAAVKAPQKSTFTRSMMRWA